MPGNGWRQRREADRSRSPRKDVGPLGFGIELTSWLRNWAWGKLHGVDVGRNSVHKMADDAQSNRCTCPHIRRLAKTANENDAERKVKSMFPYARYPQEIRIEDSSVDTLLLPSATFRWLQKLNSRKFSTHFGAHPDGVSDWWAQLASTDEGRSLWSLHPWLAGKTPADLKFHVPLVLFDDAGPISKANSSYCRCYYSILGIGSDKETRIIIATGLKVEGIDRSWPPILGSFEDLAGEPAEGEWGGILLFVGADMEYVCNELGMSHYNSKHVCGYCDANDSSLPHTDNSFGALWRATVRNNLQFLAKFRLPRHPLVAHAFFNVHTYRLDIMHLLDHHGVTSHIAGNTIYIQLRERDGILPGSTIDERLGMFNNDLMAFYSTTGCRNRLPPLRQSNLMGDSGYPELRGQLIKAANTRSLVPYLLDLQQRACTANNTIQNRHMLKVLDSLQKLYEIFYGAEYFLTTAEKNLFTSIATEWGRTTRCWLCKP